MKSASARDRAGRTELHYAAVDGRLSDVERLVASGQDVSAKDKMMMTPLHMACQQGHADVAKGLLDAGAEVDPRDGYGNTPLWRAVFAFRGDGQLIRQLLDRGANPDNKNAADKSPRELALTLDKPGLRELFSQ